VDLRQKLVFQDVVQTSLPPDIVIWSTVPKVMILVELTVPWEERTDEANERKRSMYQELADLCRVKGENERPNRTDTVETTRNEERTTPDTVTRPCGKVCKNFRGLKIHQARKSCQRTKSMWQRKGLPNKTGEKTGPVSNHSTSSLSAPVLSLAGRGCSHKEFQYLEPIIETQTTKGGSSDSEQSLTPTTNEESPIFGQYRTEDSPIFPPRARDNLEVIPNQDKAEPSSVTASRKAPNFTKRQKVAWPRTHDKKWDVFDEDLEVILQSALQGRVERRSTS